MMGTSELIEKISSLSISDDGVFPIRDLPELPRNRILVYLRLWELMDLRLVSKTTKQWVDESHMDKFLVCIKSHQQIEEMMNSDTSPGWREVKVLCDSEMHNQDWIQNPLYLNLLQKLAPHLSTLIIEGHRLPHTGLVNILRNCKNLNRLNIGILDCKNWSKEIPNDEVTACLENLEHLSVEYLAWNEEKDLELFQIILLQCKSLTALKVPHILMASLFGIGDTDDEDTDKQYLELVERRMVNPVVEYLKKRGTRDTIIGKRSFRKLNVENLHHTEIFPVLANTCHASNVRLLNVSEAFENVVPTEQIPFVEAIESLNGFTNYLNFHKLTNLKKIKLDTETSADSSVAQECINAKLPKLKYLEFCLPEDIDTSILMLFVKQPKPNVISLKIEFEVEEPNLSTLFQISDITNNFRNLRELSFIQWDGKDSDLITVLNNLLELRSLRLQKCVKITDEGLIGEDNLHPVLSNLKNLKKLWLDCSISDRVLRDVVSQLELEEFFYSSQLITLVGLSALTKGSFANSVIVFQGCQPDDCSDKEFEAILKRFKNLKRSPNWLE